MRNKLLFIFLIFLKFSDQAGAQQVEKGFELSQMIKVAEVYRQASNLSFDFTYTYADSSHPSTLLESLSGSSKIKQGLYWTVLDSVEFIQGSQYNLAVYYRDSSIIVNDRQQYGSILKLQVMDSLFRLANMDSVTINTSDDSTRLLTMYFKAQSSYCLYKLFYDKNKFRVRNIQYYIRNMPDYSGSTTGITGLITLSLTNYSDNTIDPAFFQEDKFIYQKDGDIYAQPNYTGFRISNNLTTKLR